MIRIILVFLVVLNAAIAAQDPRAIAETVLAAWAIGDAKSLNAVAHPEFKRRCRDSRIVYFYTEGKEEQKKIVIAGSDAEVVGVFCEALRSIVPPRDSRLEYFDRYVDSTSKDDFMIVRFDSSWKRKSDGAVGPIFRNEVVLKKSGNDWLFLWMPAAQIHIDLAWDPRK